MRVKLPDGWYLCDQADRPDFDYWQEHAIEPFIAQRLTSCQSNYFVMLALRSLLARSSFGLANDDEVIRQISFLIHSGRLTMRRHFTRLPIATMSGIEPSAASPFPIEPWNPPVVAPGPSKTTVDLPVFAENFDPAAIAEVQKNAAFLGIPFCEECLRQGQQGTSDQ